jgi:hypothetical protein
MLQGPARRCEAKTERAQDADATLAATRQVAGLPTGTRP